MSGIDPERRRQFLNTLASWLDELTEAEPSPPGVAPEAL